MYGSALTQTCTLCAANTHDNSGAASNTRVVADCLACAATQTTFASPLLGGSLIPSDRRQCSTCPAGFASSGTGSSTTCAACAVGTYAIAGATGCTRCDWGKTTIVAATKAGAPKSLDGVDYISAPGTMAVGAADCSACPVGRHFTTTAVTDSGSYDCPTCTVPDTYQDQTGQETCKSCPLGKGSLATEAFNNDPAHYRKSSALGCAYNMVEEGDLYCTEPGTFGTLSADSCTDVPTESNTCATCPAGNYTHGTQRECYSCPAGRTVPEEGTSSADHFTWDACSYDLDAAPTGTCANAGSSDQFAQTWSLAKNSQDPTYVTFMQLSDEWLQLGTCCVGTDCPNDIDTHGEWEITYGPGQAIDSQRPTIAEKGTGYKVDDVLELNANNKLTVTAVDSLGGVLDFIVSTATGAGLLAQDYTITTGSGQGAKVNQKFAGGLQGQLTFQPDTLERPSKSSGLSNTDAEKSGLVAPSDTPVRVYARFKCGAGTSKDCAKRGSYHLQYKITARGCAPGTTPETVNGKTTCVACAANTYKENVGNGACSACPANKTIPATGLTPTISDVRDSVASCAFPLKAQEHYERDITGKERYTAHENVTATAVVIQEAGEVLYLDAKWCPETSGDSLGVKATLYASVVQSPPDRSSFWRYGSLYWFNDAYRNYLDPYDTTWSFEHDNAGGMNMRLTHKEVKVPVSYTAGKEIETRDVKYMVRIPPAANKRAVFVNAKCGETKGCPGLRVAVVARGCAIGSYGAAGSCKVCPENSYAPDWKFDAVPAAVPAKDVCTRCPAGSSISHLASEPWQHALRCACQPDAPALLANSVLEPDAAIMKNDTFRCNSNGEAIDVVAAGEHIGNFSFKFPHDRFAGTLTVLDEKVTVSVDSFDSINAVLSGDMAVGDFVAISGAEKFSGRHKVTNVDKPNGIFEFNIDDRLGDKKGAGPMKVTFTVEKKMPTKLAFQMTQRAGYILKFRAKAAVDGKFINPESCGQGVRSNSSEIHKLRMMAGDIMVDTITTSGASDIQCMPYKNAVSFEVHGDSRSKRLIGVDVDTPDADATSGRTAGLPNAGLSPAKKTTAGVDKANKYVFRLQPDSDGSAGFRQVSNGVISNVHSQVYDDYTQSTVLTVGAPCKDRTVYFYAETTQCDAETNEGCEASIDVTEEFSGHCAQDRTTRAACSSTTESPEALKWYNVSFDLEIKSRCLSPSGLGSAGRLLLEKTVAELLANRSSQIGQRCIGGGAACLLTSTTASVDKTVQGRGLGTYCDPDPYVVGRTCTEDAAAASTGVAPAVADLWAAAKRRLSTLAGTRARKAARNLAAEAVSTIAFESSHEDRPLATSPLRYASNGDVREWAAYSSVKTTITLSGIIARSQEWANAMVADIIGGHWVRDEDVGAPADYLDGTTNGKAPATGKPRVGQSWGTAEPFVIREYGKINGRFGCNLAEKLSTAFKGEMPGVFPWVNIEATNTASVVPANLTCPAVVLDWWAIMIIIIAAAFVAFGSGIVGIVCCRKCNACCFKKPAAPEKKYELPQA